LRRVRGGKDDGSSRHVPPIFVRRGGEGEGGGAIQLAWNDVEIDSDETCDTKTPVSKEKDKGKSVEKERADKPSRTTPRSRVPPS